MKVSTLLLHLAALATITVSAIAQESPYFVTYDHHLEEPGNLEVSLTPMFGAPRNGPAFVASSIELEYGIRDWWTTALYVNGQSTSADGAVFTGYRIENRFRPLRGERWVNPVLYVEYADINGADKVVKEVVGFDSWRDLATPNREARREKEREIETRLILSRNDRGWNYAGNVIAEKNLDGGAVEFGYAIGGSRPLAENITAGIEVFGGLGESGAGTLSQTSHYLAPAVAWSLPKGVTLRLSPAIGLTSESSRALIRVGIAYDISLHR